jgi:hypothetical protein
MITTETMGGVISKAKGVAAMSNLKFEFKFGQGSVLVKTELPPIPSGIPPVPAPKLPDIPPVPSGVPTAPTIPGGIRQLQSAIAVEDMGSMIFDMKVEMMTQPCNLLNVDITLSGTITYG